MKKHFFTLVSLILFGSVSSKTPVQLKQNNIGIRFTENKGQVHDQYRKPRPDVLYGVMTRNMAVHIKTSGVSYQLSRTDSYKDVEDPKTKELRQEPDLQSIYRIDLNWLNCNKNFINEAESPSADYTNYYLGNSEDGVLKVKSYKGITLRNLYKGIDLHYYEKNSELKHDYIVAAHADYKQIQIKVEGAEISISEDGSLFFSTPLGKVQEGAPLVFQNGKQLKSKWLIKNNILSFKIENYDANYELLIDPLTRLWGTYYGDNVSSGSGAEYGFACATDVNNNVYHTGYTEGSTGTVIATIGAHQATFTGPRDVYLVKFNASGVRLWGTYYGGGGERAFGCTTDLYGNVFVTGIATATSGVATAGAHQPLKNVGAFGEAFLVKFDGNGVRQWGTYYGGTGNDVGMACIADASGNIYMAGHSVWGGTVIATAGAQQTVYGGGNGDAMLVKFNSAGVRLWATYYGGSGHDFGTGCAVDASGNVYLTGETTSTNTNVMSTPGSHQATMGTSGLYSFLVKFDPSGVRLWGTYYGTTAGSRALSCCVDPTNNVYMSGNVSSFAGMSTPGSHQVVHAGGWDAYLVKFNSAGVRIWGTYYGSPFNETGYSCATDAAGNVYLAGSSVGSISNVLSTPGSFQISKASNTDDAYLVKFDAAGVRLAGTYYGAVLVDFGYSCATDGAGNVYLAGTTGGGTGMGSVGSHQPTYGGSIADGYLAKFEECTAPPAQPLSINGASVVCAGYTITYSTGIAIGASSYSWSLPTGWSGATNGPTIATVAGSSGVFSLVVGNGCGASPQQTLNVTVNPVPTVVVSSGVICEGDSFTLTASGANTYTYLSGQVVTPTSTTAYYVTGANTFGCTQTMSGNVYVNLKPIVWVSSGAICEGQSYTMQVSGASTYTFSSGGPLVSPAASTSYSVIGKSTAGCVSSNTAVSLVTVNTLPNVSVLTTNAQLCVGETATLTGNGATTYTFDFSYVGNALTVSPVVTTTYTVTGKDVNGCQNTAEIIQLVDECTALKENSFIGNELKLYPNPNKGVFKLKLDTDAQVTISNALGLVVYFSKLSLGSHLITLENLANGVYVVKVCTADHSKSSKVVKE